MDQTQLARRKAFYDDDEMVEIILSSLHDAIDMGSTAVLKGRLGTYGPHLVVTERPDVLRRLADVIEGAAKAYAIEAVHGVGSLLDLSHPSIRKHLGADGTFREGGIPLAHVQAAVRYRSLPREEAAETSFPLSDGSADHDEAERQERCSLETMSADLDIGSCVVLRANLKRFGPQLVASTSVEVLLGFASFLRDAARAFEIEAAHGEGSLLNLDHPWIRKQIEMDQHSDRPILSQDRLAAAARYRAVSAERN